MKNSKYLISLLTISILTACNTVSSSSVNNSSDKPISQDNTSQEVVDSSKKDASSSKQEEKLDIKEVKVDHYNISYCPYLDEDSRSMLFEGKWSDYKTANQFDFCYLEGQEELPYLSLDTYASLLAKDFKDGYSVSAKEEGSASIFEVKQNDKSILSIKFDTNNKKATRSPGSLETVMKPLSDLKNSVNEYIQTNEDFISGGDLDFVYTWENTGFITFTHDNKNYFPLSLLDLQISRDTSRYFWYIGGNKAIYEAGDSKQFNEVSLSSTNEQGIEVMRKVNDYAIDNFTSKYAKESEEQGLKIKEVFLPEYLTRYNRDSFYYVMDNFYGLGEVIGYKSMSDYLNNTVYAEQMLSPDGKVRSKAYAYACGILNDGHTGFTGASCAGEGTGLGMFYDQTLLTDRMALQRILKDRRDEELKKENKLHTDVRYSTDGKVAYFSFDEFNAVNYDPKDGKPDSINKDDTYLLFLNNLKEIKAKGGVEKVIIDDTINGGGYVGQLLKLLCLLSKDNSTQINFRQGENNAIGRITAKVDTNLDGKIDASDTTFGNDFKFYILTTSYSFSCGNAFPRYAKDLGIATIVGSKTGGGECVVGGNQLPYGSFVGYSSNIHLGMYNQTSKTFYGYEEGASPDYAYSGNYYNVDTVAAILK